MNCKKCGAVLIEGATFCGHCGGRADGKKVCAGCGAEFEDKFCPYCGKSETEGKGNLKGVSDIIANAAMLLGAVFALIFVFFIGLKMQMEGEAEESVNIFYYFGTYAKEMEALNFQQMNTTPWFIRSMEGQLNAGGAIGLILTVLILLTTVTFAILAIVKYCVGWANGKHVNVEGWALASVISFLVGAVSFFAFNNVLVEGSASVVGGASGVASSVEGRVKFDDLTVTAIVLCAICVIVSTVFRMIFAGKTLWTKENLGKQVFSFLLIILSAALFGISQGALMEMEVSAQTGNALVGANFLNFSSGFTIGVAGAFTEETASGYYAVTGSIATINNFGVFAALFSVALTAFSALSLMQNLRNVKGEDTAQRGKLWAILALVSAVLLLVCNIFMFVGVTDVAKTMSAAASEDLLQGNFTVAILGVIFAVAVLVLTLVAEKKTRKEEPVA